MKKKILTAVLSLAMVCSLTACGQSSASSDTKEGTHIYILTASEDHGWTGSVATFAKEKAEEINNDGTYSAEVITSADANEQITKVEDLVAKGDDNIAVVIQPMDDTVQSAIQQLADAEIPYVAFDRIIDAVSSSAVSNVKGDNEGIGAGAAAYFVSLGLQPGEEIYVYEGDTSSVTTLRDEGFTNWSRSDTKASYESLMGDAANASIKWFYAEDDELSMGILEALNGGGISDSTKEAIYKTKPVITGCGGLDEYYEVIRGNSYQDVTRNLGGVMSVTYSPAMIQTAIQDMVDYLDGKEVEQDHVISCENVVPENVDNYPSF